MVSSFGKLRLPLVAVLFACGLLLSGCGDEDQQADAAADAGGTDTTDSNDTSDGQLDGGPDTAPDANEPPEMPVALCGMESYELLPTTEVGELLDWEPMAQWSLSSGTMDAIMVGAGLDYLTPVPYGMTTYRFRYTTQDRGQVVEATGALSIPDAPDLASNELPTVLNIHGTSGWSDPCAPTGDPRSMYNALGAYVASWGYIAVSPDHIGMNGFGDGAAAPHAYMHGEQIAIGSWDAVRAAESLLAELEGDISADGRVVLLGASQGGHGVVFADLYHPYYAPEYELTAAVADVPPMSLFYLLEHTGEDEGLTINGLLATVLVTQSQWYGRGDLSTLLTNTDPHYFADTFVDAIYDTETCPTSAYPDPEVTDHAEMFTAEFLDAARNERWDEIEPWSCFLRENSLDTTSTPALSATPMLMVFGGSDILVPPAYQRSHIETLCEAGQQIEYLECASLGHVDAALGSVPATLEWIEARLSGVPIDAERLCVISEPVCCPGGPEPCTE